MISISHLLLQLNPIPPFDHLSSQFILNPLLSVIPLPLLLLPILLILTVLEQRKLIPQRQIVLLLERSMVSVRSWAPR